MANDSGRYFTNAVAGQINVGADINLLQVDATPKFPVGTVVTRGDGNTYHYGYASGGVAAGYVVAPTFASAGVTAITKGVKSITASTAVAGDAIAVGAQGSRFVQITYAGVTKNLYAGGYFITALGSGVGYTYRIKGCTATGDPVSGDFRLELKEPLAVTLYSSTNWIIVPCMWNDLVVADTSTNVAPCGVSMGTTTTSKPYGWFCTRGVVGVYTPAANPPSLGQGVQLSSGTSGTVTFAGFGGSTAALLQGNTVIGQCIQPANAAAGLCTIMLNLGV